MSLKADMIADVESVFLDTDEFAEQYVRWPQGKQQYADTVTALFIPMAAQKRTANGESFETLGKLQYSANDSYHPLDQWFINGTDAEPWVLYEPHETVHGMRALTLKRVDRKRHKQGGFAG